MKKTLSFPPMKAINNFFKKISEIPDRIKKRKIKYVYDFAVDFYKTLQKSNKKNIDLPPAIYENLAKERAAKFVSHVIKKGWLDDFYKTFKQAEEIAD